MSNADYGFSRRNEFGDEFAYKSGTGAKSRWVGSRVNLGKTERKTFTGTYSQALDKWGEWAHACVREAPPEQVEKREEKEMPRGVRLTDDMRAEIEELLEVGDMSQQEIADAYGISQKCVSNVKKGLDEKQARREERQRIREEERRLRAEERERDRPEPMPDAFKPRVQEQPERKAYYVITSNPEVTLFESKAMAEQVARMLNSVMNGSPLNVVECKLFGEEA